MELNVYKYGEDLEAGCDQNTFCGKKLNLIKKYWSHRNLIISDPEF